MNRIFLTQPSPVLAIRNPKMYNNCIVPGLLIDCFYGIFFPVNLNLDLRLGVSGALEVSIIFKFVPVPVTESSVGTVFPIITISTTVNLGWDKGESLLPD